ncbi:MAG: hypothetical protein ACUVTG_15980 [Candidatus Oleimicrobiaceae bacterium]
MAVAELILWPLRQAVRQRLLMPRIPGEAFVRKLDRVKLTVHQKNALTTIVRRAVRPESIDRSLKAAEGAARLFRITPHERTRLLGRLQNLRSELTKAGDFYEQYVLDRALAVVQVVSASGVQRAKRRYDFATAVALTGAA